MGVLVLLICVIVGWVSLGILSDIRYRPALMAAELEFYRDQAVILRYRMGMGNRPDWWPDDDSESEPIPIPSPGWNPDRRISPLAKVAAL